MRYPLDTACGGLGMLLVAAHGLSYFVVCCWLSVLHLYLTACPVFLHVCCGFIWIANLL